MRLELSRRKGSRRAALGKWISVAEPPDAEQVISLRREHRLDQGESEAILVAEKPGKPPLLMGTSGAEFAALGRRE